MTPSSLEVLVVFGYSWPFLSNLLFSGKDGHDVTQTKHDLLTRMAMGSIGLLEYYGH